MEKGFELQRDARIRVVEMLNQGLDRALGTNAQGAGYIRDAIQLKLQSDADINATLSSLLGTLASSYAESNYQERAGAGAGGAQQEAGDQTFTEYVRGAPGKDIYDYFKGIPSKEGGPLTEEDLASKDTKDTIAKGYTPTQVVGDIARGGRTTTGRAVSASRRSRQIPVQAAPRSSKPIPVQTTPRSSRPIPASVTRRSKPLPARTGP